MQSEFNNELFIREGGRGGLTKFVKAIIEAQDKGYILDPDNRSGYVPSQRLSGIYEVTLVKTEEAVKNDLASKSPEELVTLIKEDESKQRLLELAEVLNIGVPESKKVPKAISKFLCETVMGGNYG